MAEATAVPYGRKTQREPAVKEVHVLWITAGLSCDGDSVSVTAATQPSIEDIVMGAIPGLPKVHLHNPVLAYEGGDEFMKYWYEADEGRLGRAVRPGHRGLDPQREDQERGLLGRAGHRQADRPADHHLRVDRPPRAQGLWPSSRPAPAPPTAASTRWPATRPARMGLADYLGWNWRSKAGVPIVNVPGCPVQPDNMTETLLYLLYQVGGPGPDDPARRAAAADLAVRQDGARGLRPRPATTSRPTSPTSTARPSAWCKIGCWGPVVNCNVTKRGWMAGIGGCPNVGGICIGCTMPGFPDKFMPFMDEPPGGILSSTADRHVRPGHPQAPRRSPTPRSTRSRSGGTAAPS